MFSEKFLYQYHYIIRKASFQYIFSLSDFFIFPYHPTFSFHPFLLRCIDFFSILLAGLLLASAFFLLCYQVFYLHCLFGLFCHALAVSPFVLCSLGSESITSSYLPKNIVLKKTDILKNGAFYAII